MKHTCCLLTTTTKICLKRFTALRYFQTGCVVARIRIHDRCNTLYWFTNFDRTSLKGMGINGNTVRLFRLRCFNAEDDILREIHVFHFSAQ